MNKIKILKARKEDFLEIRNLDRLILGKNVADGEHIWKNWIEFCKVIKAVNNRRIAGAGLLIPTFKGHLFLHKIFVRPSFQNQNIGFKIMEKLLEDEEDKDIYLTVDPTNKRAINLYKESNFKISKKIKGYYRKTEDRLLMKKKAEIKLYK